MASPAAYGQEASVGDALRGSFVDQHTTSEMGHRYLVWSLEFGLLIFY